MRIRSMVLAVGLLVAVGAARGSDGQAANEVIATGVAVGSWRAAPVTGEPYSATQTNQMTQTLTDGTKVRRHGHHLVARDSAGRVMVERRLQNAKDGQPEIRMISVMDPVNRTLTTWMVGTAGPQVATVFKLKDRGLGTPGVTASNGEAKGESPRPQPVVTTEDLGTQLIDGVAATGKLKTIVVPAGRMGNDQPITRTYEVWKADEMKLILLQKWEDPLSGERIVQFANFSRAEPDPAMFHPPAGYQTRTLEQTLKELADKLNQMAAQE